ncbi:MAG: PmeII family type II restriction endonuclease [Candidatus Micrarchaeota archaeon]
MKKNGLRGVAQFVETGIRSFHKKRLESLETTSLTGLLKKKNPYLYKAKNLVTAQGLVETLLDAKLSSSEEEIFGEFLESLALFVAQKRVGAEKSSAHGIDFEYTAGGTRHLVAVKSGLNWGNSSQWTALHNDFNTAEKILRQSEHITSVKKALGICYGKAKTTTRKGVLQVCGQNFWFMITGDEDFYKEIVEPLGHKAKELNDEFAENKTRLVNKFTKEFITDFCDGKGAILWERLVEFNSGNLTENDKTELQPAAR